MAAYDASWLQAVIKDSITLSVFEAVGDSLGDEKFLDFVSTGGLEFGYELALAFNDFGIFSISHEFKVDSGFGAGDFKLGFVNDGYFLFLGLCIAHLVLVLVCN